MEDVKNIVHRFFYYHHFKTFPSITSPSYDNYCSVLLMLEDEVNALVRIGDDTPIEDWKRIKRYLKALSPQQAADLLEYKNRVFKKS